MTQFSLYLDIAGRMTKGATDDRFFTVGGVLVDTLSDEAIQASLGHNFAKWKHAQPHTLDVASGVLNNDCRACVLITVEKTQPWWDNFWDRGAKQHRDITFATNSAAGFVRPGTVLRLWALTSCAAALLGSCLRRHGSPRPLDQRGPVMLRLRVICDMDIQGDENQSVFRSSWETWAHRTRLSAVLGVQPYIDLAEFRRATGEPILKLADVLAGFGYFDRSGGGAAAAPSGLGVNEIRQFAEVIGSLGNVERIALNFKEVFPNLTGQSS